MKDQISKLCISLLLMIALALSLSVPIAANETVTQDDLVARISDSLDITALSQGPKERVIFCYAVNEKGWFAIGYRQNMVHVYDEHGEFQYGFRFHVDGLYALDFKGDNLVIYLCRSDIAAEIDPAGNCVRAEKEDFVDGPLKDVFHPSSTKIGSITYSLERDIGIFDGAYSRLVATDEGGNRTVLYDVTVTGYFAGVSHYFLVLAFPAIAVWLTVSKIKQEEQNEEQDLPNKSL